MNSLEEDKRNELFICLKDNVFCFSQYVLSNQQMKENLNEASLDYHDKVKDLENKMSNLLEDFSQERNNNRGNIDQLRKELTLTNEKMAKSLQNNVLMKSKVNIF